MEPLNDDHVAAENPVIEDDSAVNEGEHKNKIDKLIKDGSLIPAISDGDHSMKLRIEGYPVDPRLQLFVSGIAYPLSLEFRAKDISSLQYQVETSEYTTVLSIQLQIQIQGCIKIGLTDIKEDDVIEKIRHHMLQISSLESKIKLNTFIDSELHDHFINQLESLPKFGRLPWYPYCGTISGTHMTQYGQMRARADLQAMMESQQIMKVPVSNHFYDVDEAAIIFVYGAYLEHQITSIYMNRLGNVEHKLTIFSIPESKILLGAIQFGRLSNTFTPTLSVDAPPMISDGTNCVVSIQMPETKATFHFDAVSVPNVISLPVPYNTILLLLQPEEFRSSNSSIVNHFSAHQKPEKEIGCKLKFNLNTSNLKSQINAINTLCSDFFIRWHPILLNHDYEELGKVNVFQKVPEVEVQAAYERVYAMKPWNKKQLQVFQLLQHVPGNGFAFIEGIFGCGKTLVQVMLAKLLVDLGKHVLIVTTTNAALQAISETIVHHAPDLDAARVVFAGSEKTKKFGRQDEQPQTEKEEYASFRLLQDMLVVDKVTFSRSNPKIVKVVSDILAVIFKETPYPTSTITIVTSYNAQKALYLNVIREVQLRTGLPFAKLPPVETIDSMQGHESDIVILDWVNEYGYNLGFLRDDRRVNVALSRARASLIVLFHASYTAIMEDEPEIRNWRGRRAKRPQVLDNWDWIVRNRLELRLIERE